MWDTLPPWAAQGGAVGLLLAIVAGIFLGRLIPRAWHTERIIEIKKDRDDWKAAWGLEVERGHVMQNQLDRVLGNGEAQLALLRALPKAKDSV